MSVRARARYELRAEDKSKKAFKSFGASIRGSVKMMGGLKTAIAGVLGAGSLGLLIKQSLDAGDHIQKMSIRLGASTEALSQFRHVAQLTGVDFRTFTMGLQRMTRRLAEAAVGTGEARGALKELGLDAKSLVQLSPEQQFLMIAQAMQQVSSSSDKVRLAMKLFDSEGVALLQTMEGGAEAIRAMMMEADALGLTLSRTEADALAGANDAITRMKGAVSGLSTELAVNLAPAITSIADMLKFVLPGAVDVATAIFRGFKVAILSVFLGIAKAIEGTFGLLSKLPGGVGARFKELQATASGVSSSLLADITGVADAVIGGRAGAGSPGSAVPAGGPLALGGGGDAEESSKKLKTFLKELDRTQRVGQGRQISLEREGLGKVGEQKKTIVEGPILKEAVAVLKQIRDNSRDSAAVVGA